MCQNTPEVQSKTHGRGEARAPEDEEPCVFVKEESSPPMPPMLLPFGRSRGFFLLFDEFDVLLDDVLGNLCCEVDEVHILVELVEGLHAVVVLEVAIYKGDWGRVNCH